VGYRSASTGAEKAAEKQRQDAQEQRESRQTCVDVLCAYLRMPYEPEPGQDTPKLQQLAFQASREIRTVIRIITAHLKEDAAVSWQGLNFDFTGVVSTVVTLRVPSS
jgi:hypothetical protein